MSMNRTRFAFVCFLCSFGLVSATSCGLMAQLVPLGPEIQLESDIFPNKPLLAVQPGGAGVIAWWYAETASLDSVSYSFIAAGGRPTSELEISSPVELPQVDAITATATGFDVMLSSQGEGGPKDFYLSHLNLRGIPERRRLHLVSRGFDWVWQIPGNGFLAGWRRPHAHAIAGRRLNASGRRPGPELALNSRPVDEASAVVIPLAGGGIVAAWLGTLPGSTAGSASTRVLRARRFSSTVTPLGLDFDLNTTPLRVDWNRGPYIENFQIAAAPDGGFAAAWAYGDTVNLRFFDATGQALGPEIPVVKSDHVWSSESISFDDAGNLLLLWGVNRNGLDLRLRLFDPHGAPLGPLTGVRSAASNDFPAPWTGSVAWAGDSWLVAWAALQAPAGDFSNLFVRRFSVNPGSQVNSSISSP